MKSILDRRSLIKAGGLALGLPWLEYFAGSQAMAADAGFTADGVPKRLFVVFNGLGTIPSEWCDINGGQATFKKILKPLEKHRERMTIIRGLTHASRGGTHEAVELAALTGQPYVGDRKTTKFAAGISIDQHIANVIGKDTVRKSISLSLQGKSQYNPLSHFGPSQPNFPIKNPYTAFDQILSNITGPTGPALTRAEKLQQKREQVLRETHQRYKELHARIGQDDKARLDAHLESLNTLIRALDLQQGQEEGDANTCQVMAPSNVQHSLLPKRDADSKFITEEYRYGGADLDRNQDIVKTYMDIGVQAFACDVSRVVTLDQGHFHRHGSASHKVDVNNRNVSTAEYDEVLNAGVRSAQNISYLVDQLVNTPDGKGGNLMDSSLIYWIQSHQDGKNHSLTNSTDVLIGNAGGMFNTNRAITINPSENRRHTELLTSIANCFDLTDTGFGNNDWRGKGRIDELGIQV